MAVAAAVAGAVACAAGCSGTAPGSQAPQPGKDDDRRGGGSGHRQPPGSTSPSSGGYFAAVGLHVKIVNIISAEDAISAQLQGKFDVTLGNYVSYIQADAEQHADIRIIDEGSVIQPNDQGIVTLPGSPLTTLADLRGKRLAVNVPNNIGNILIGSALAGQGLPLSAVKLVAVPFPLMTAALQQHKVDAAWVPEPFLTGAEEQIGALSIYDLDQGCDGGPAHRRLRRHRGLGAEVPGHGGRVQRGPGARAAPGRR